MYRKWGCWAAPLAAANILFMAMFIAFSGEWLIYEHNDSKLLQQRWRKGSMVYQPQMRCCVMKYGFKRRRTVWKGGLSLVQFLCDDLFPLLPQACFLLQFFFKVKSSTWHLMQRFNFCFSWRSFATFQSRRYQPPLWFVKNRRHSVD